MTTETAVEVPIGKPSGPNRKIWVYAIVIIVIVGIIGYFSYLNRKDSFANHNYYRVLYEASNTFNENLIKLHSMHRYKESVTSIRSLMPSYSREKKQIDTTAQNTEQQTEESGSSKSTQNQELQQSEKSDSSKVSYALSGQKLKITASDFTAELEFADILPLPKQGFSQFLFADDDEIGSVLATVGGERTISIVDLRNINQQLLKKNKQFQLNFTDPKNSLQSDKPSDLPSYSSHVDMELSYGEFRIFVFPFTLATEVSRNGSNIQKLYLVGLLPADKLIARGTGYWNVSLVMVALVSLLFMWNILRLYLLPKNQSITRMYRHFSTASSYLFYIVILALVLAYMQKSALQGHKDNQAKDYAIELASQLKLDLLSVFNQLDSYRPFYQKLIEGVQTEANNAQELQTALSALKVQAPDSIQTLVTNLSLKSDTVSSAKVTRFNEIMNRSLHVRADAYCDINTRQDGKFPTWSAIPTKTEFEINYPCNDDKPNNFVTFDLEARNTLLAAFIVNKPDVNTLDFYGGFQQISVTAGEESVAQIAPEQFAPYNKKGENYRPHDLLTAFAVNTEGNSTMPSIYFQESNAFPSTFSLSHRDYYKLVRDRKGWDLNLTTAKDKKTFKNVYIQRLLNINNGTRGTTISMPIAEPFGIENQSQTTNGLTSTQLSDSNLLGYILGADVILPSLTLGATPPVDFTYMVIERATGKVLFHNDTDRSLVENLHYSGNTSSNLSQWIKAGLDYSNALNEKTISGHYHGQPGRFIVQKTVVDAWAMVVFYPDDSLHAFMTNQFLYISITFVLIILLMTGTVFAVRHFVYTDTLKKKLKLPVKCNVRLIILLSSIMLSVSYGLFSIGQLLDLSNSQIAGLPNSLVLPAVGVIIVGLIGYQACIRHFCHPSSLGGEQTSKTAKIGSKRLTSAVVVIVVGHLWYLAVTADMPLKSLQYHYQQVACNGLNHERKELIKIGLSRYPNSVTQLRLDPLTLLPIQSEWAQRLNPDSGYCAKHPNQVLPDHYPNLSTLVGATYLWQWINMYLLEDDIEDLLLISIEKIEWPLSSALQMIILLAVLIWAWFMFNVRLLWTRLYCPERFLRHIKRMHSSISKLPLDDRSDKLFVECDTIKLNGIGLALLIRSVTFYGSNKISENAKDMLPGFEDLYDISPCLQKFSSESRFLPNLKLNIVPDASRNEHQVELWDIETCLEKAEFRQPLLDLIMELKSLALCNKIGKFTIFAGFHSLQRVKIKDPLALDQHAVLEHTEYISWADCLMDFTIMVPPAFKQNLNYRLLHKEVADFPELHFLYEDELKARHDLQESTEFWKSSDDLQLESRWSTINYILLHAEALYRFKWESCSSAEKLALINLAKSQRLNPTNTQMIEHLALNGLVMVRKGSIEIVNHSFAHFVLHAETAETVNILQKHGQAGVWNNYKLPLGITLLLLIGGIALTSGESIYIIAASVAGVLGTIAGVTNSANMLRGQFRE